MDPEDRIPDDDLLDSSTAFHAILPAELRRMVYDYLLDDEGMDRIVSSLVPGPEMYPRRWGHAKGQADLRYTNAKFVNLTVLTEIAAQFLNTYKGAYVYNVESLADFLEEDFFGVGIKPCDYIRTLHMQIEATPTKNFDQIGTEHIKACFSPLLC
jgi:hypothetical protein